MLSVISRLAFVLLVASSVSAQSICPHGQVVDEEGAAIGGATVRLVPAGVAAQSATGTPFATTDQTGRFALPCPRGLSGFRIRAEAVGFASSERAVPAGREGITVVLRPAAVAQQIEVAATRTTVTLGPHAETIEVLSAGELNRFPALTLDESLRQHAGFELFRRSSSYIANPTSQGISLRGLGSTAASRTLVLLDGTPLNDPFGGWIHWNELAPEAVSAVTLATGGGSDLYGSSALGGVIDVLPLRPTEDSLSLATSAAGEDTATEHGAASLRQGPWTELIAGQGFRTAGYIPVASSSRGPVDRPANVHFQNGRVEVARSQGGLGRAFLQGNLLNEARNNGTTLQTNGTRLWRWSGGEDWSAGQRGSGSIRLFGSNEGYRQSFSAVNGARSVETLTRLQHVRTAEFGASATTATHWSYGALVLGVDLRDLRATDREQPVSRGVPASLQDTSARQRFVGGFVEGLLSRGAWSGALSLRVDSARNLDTRVQISSGGGPPTTTRLPDREELVLSPRLGVVRQLPRHIEAHAAAFRAFRTPTLNELYRTGQVGQEITQANAQLSSERATGAEGGVAWTSPGALLNVHGNYFWTAINRPVSAVLIATTPTGLTNRRENLGQIVSQGLESAVRVGEGHRVSGEVGYQYAHAAVTRFSASPALVGLRIPQVPRHSMTAQLRVNSFRWGTLVLADRASGEAFDDSSNRFRLGRFHQLDLYAEHALPHGITAFVSLQNLLNQRADVARTPVLTLGTPVLAQGGVRYTWPGRQR